MPITTGLNPKALRPSKPKKAKTGRMKPVRPAKPKDGKKETMLEKLLKGK